MALAGRLQQLQQVQAVGKCSLVAARQRPQVSLVKAQRHFHEALGKPLLTQRCDVGAGRGPAVLVLAQRIQGRGIVAQPRRGQRRHQQSIIFHVQNTEQCLLQAGRLVAVEDIVRGAQVNRIQPQLAQRSLHLGGLETVAHQDGDVRRRQGRTLQAGLAQQACNLFCSPARQMLLTGPGVTRAAFVRTGQCRVMGQQTPLETTPRGRIFKTRKIGAPRPHRVVVNAEAKDIAACAGGQVGTIKKPVVTADHALGGAVVGVHHPLRVGIIPSLQVGEHITAAKSVNGLLGVTDHAQQPW